MKHLILASAAVLSLATAGSALAARPQVKLQELAASGRPQPQTDAQSTNYAWNGMPVQNTAARATQLAAGQHPQADTDRRATQLAAGGGNHPDAVTNAHATQLAASGIDYVRRSHGQYT